MTHVKQTRLRLGLSQAALADRAGVSRQAIGAIEAGRHLPRVDAALAIAAALGEDVDALFAPDRRPADVLSGQQPGEGSTVRVGRVGDRLVTVAARAGGSGFDAADAVVENGSVVEFGRRLPGMVVAGCEPGMAVLEQILREGGMAAIAASASTKVALSALKAGRAHAAIVHGSVPAAYLEGSDASVERYRLCRWRVGLAAPAGTRSGWAEEALSGVVPVVQREAGAGVQQTFENAAGRSGIEGPRVGSHLESAQYAMVTGLAGVTIEPAARALGMEFHALQAHDAELWIEARWAHDRSVAEALELIVGSRFQRRLLAVGGYDLSECGTRVA